MPLGAIVAVADLWDVVAPDDEVTEDHDACTSLRASQGKTRVCLRHVTPVEPVPYKGRTGLMSVPYEVAAGLRESDAEDMPGATPLGEGGGAVRVLVGEEVLAEPVQQAAIEGCTVSWIVPRAARPGDDVLFFFPHAAGFLGRGRVASLPEPTVFGERKTYRANVGGLSFFPSLVTLEAVAERFPEWAWARYPRGFTTPPAALAGRIFDFVREGGGANR